MRPPFLAQVFSCWNWKCALLSATARSLVYLAALARSGPHGRLSIVLVEIVYVALTAGLYAAMQQRALRLRSRALGNAIVAFGVPALAQVLDWLAHRAAGAPVPVRAIFAVSIFAAVSALFHLFVMRRGVFLTGQGRSLLMIFAAFRGSSQASWLRRLRCFISLRWRGTESAWLSGRPDPSSTRVAQDGERDHRKLPGARRCAREGPRSRRPTSCCRR